MRKVGLGWLVTTWVCGGGALGVWGCGSEFTDCASNRTCVASAGTSSLGGGNAGKGSTGGSEAGQGGSSSGGTSGGGGSVSGGGSGGGVGASGMAGEGGSDGACKGDVSNDAACWTTEEYGVFVSSDTGNDDTGEGTRAAPYKTLNKGVSASGGKHVYVCLGTQELSYAEKLSLTDGVRIYGGFECEGWTYSTSRSALVAPPKDNVALRITSVKKSVYIENVRFQSAAASGTGQEASSYGAFITDSTDVVLKRVELTAGAGKEGAKGTDGLKGDDGAVAGEAQKGTAALCELPTAADGGAWPPIPPCGSRGGDGGKAVVGADSGDGFSGMPSVNVTPSGVTNKGSGATMVNAKGADGTEGSSGNAGAAGLPASAAGVFSAGGFMPGNGTAGKDGFPGQGGGGGGASMGNASCRGASGGAGGMGGCGGKPGSGGYGGGASVGVFSWQSLVTLDTCKVTAGDGGAGGDGGKGGAGGIGASGGAGGNPVTDANMIARGGQGGLGGNGGLGGSGSGGSGGPSHALVFSGAKPSYESASTTLKSGKGGAGGAGGKLGMAQAPSGSKGDEALELEIK
jgi:hypothetical protein